MAGFLDNTTLTLKAILTKKGRELISKGEDFNITSFMVGDDGIDYGLINTAHPLGTEYYAEVIENMPVLEPIPSETLALKYPLITLSKKTTRIPVVTVSNTSITLQSGGDKAVISPSTSNFPNGNSSLGYTAILSDSDACIIRALDSAPVNISPTTPRYINDNESPQSISVVGMSFEVIAKNQPLRDKTATIIIYGNETGGRKVINLTVRKTEVATSGQDIRTS